MRKKVALFANGWTAENLLTFTTGLSQALPDNYADIYMFIGYESYGQSPAERDSQRMTYKLPDLSCFDAAIVFYPGLNFAESIEYIYDAIAKVGIPTISICNKHDGHYNIGVDNYAGMLELCNHVIEEHHCQKTLYIAGSKDNDDSNERLRALNDALNSHGLPEPVVFYSNWEAGNAKEYLQKYHCSEDTIPDAVFCANDQLASFAVLAFEEKGYKVPDDFVITGFDFNLRGQIFYPSIASVDQHFGELGRLSSKTLTGIFDNTPVDNDIIVPCSFSPAESCGCSHKCNSDDLRKDYSHRFPYRDQLDFLFKGRLFALEESILKADDYSSLRNNLLSLFGSSSGPEGKSFFLMMDPLFKNIGKDMHYTPLSFSDEMDVFIAKYNGQVISDKTCKTAQLIPSLDEYEGNNVHIFTPIFLNDFICGYMVTTNSIHLLMDDKLYDFENKFNRILVSFKRNKQLNELNGQLSELMEQDSLTRVKNRTAYEKYLKRLERDFIEGENDPFAVVYFDINNLKMVNDMYGHEKGDAYIKNSCRLMCNTFKHSPMFRIGGDEFVSIAINDDFKNRHELLRQMREHMDKLKEKGDSVPLTERISIASGMAEYDRTLDEDFASIFKRADEIMYENKYKMKQGL